jgi:methylglutaconyl-CoA hydratase
MTSTNTIITESNGTIATIWFNRPAVHNALNDIMIEEFLRSIRSLNIQDKIRIILIRARGESFCAGADIRWLQRAGIHNKEENYRDSLALAMCFHELHTSRKLTVALVQGAAYGGANGFIAACDLAFATHDAVFAFPEVRMGLIPATIAPYVLKKTGHRKSLELMLTGQKFNGKVAEEIGLVNKALPAEEFEPYVGNILMNLQHAAPVAQQETKNMLNRLAVPVIDEKLIEQSAALLANIRLSAEALEGMNAFIEKRAPNWNYN